MSATVTAGTADTEGRSTPRWLRYAGTPIALALVTWATLAWVFSQDLLSRETALLNREDIIAETLQHLYLTVVATLFVLAIAIPLGVMLTRPWSKPVRPLFLGLANLGQATPSFGVLVLIAAITGNIGNDVAITGLVIYSALPVLRNTMVGIQQVDEHVIDAARGMGLSPLQVLWRIELPLAVPVMLAGVRTTLVIVVGTAALAVFVGGDALGLYIQNGIQLASTPVLLTGAVLTAVLALAIDWLGGIAEEQLRPKGL